MNVYERPTSLAQAMTERTTVDGVTYKIASRCEEREDAFRLIYDAYVELGLMETNSAGMRVTPFHLLPTTDVFVAYHHHQVIYTMTLISDDHLGMPLETVYGSEVDQLRSSTQAYFAEVSCLAGRRGYFDRKRMFNVFVNLAALMVQSARENGIDRLLIACSPRHARFYRSFLGFSQIGQERMYSDVQNKPAVALQHDLKGNEKNHYPLKDRIYGSPYRNWELYHQPMLREEKHYFTQLSDLYHNHFPLGAVT